MAFSSLADNLVAGDTNGESDVFVRDRLLGTTVRVSSSTAGVQGNGASNRPAISDSGRYAVFQSAAANLVLGDTNGAVDVFVSEPGQSALLLALTGGCPGPVRIQIRNATPGAWLPLFYGTPGAFIRSNQPCLGMPMGLSAPILLRYVLADQAGRVDFIAHPTAAHCGTSVQAVNLGTCTTSNVEVL